MQAFVDAAQLVSARCLARPLIQKFEIVEWLLICAPRSSRPRVALFDLSPTVCLTGPVATAPPAQDCWNHMKEPSKNTLRQWLIKHRRVPIAVLHLGLIGLANYTAFWLRFDSGALRWEFVHTIAALLIIRGVLFVPFRLYEGIWRYTSIEDLRSIVAGVGLSTIAFAVYVYGYLGMSSYPRSVLMIDAMVLIFLMGGVRLTRRVKLMVHHLQGSKRVLLYGAGDAAEMIVRDLRNHGAHYDREPIGFIDDNP
jgi:hypothetical protein